MPWCSTPGVSTWAPSIMSAKARPATGGDAAVEGVDRGRLGVVAEVEEAELGAERRHELGVEPLVGAEPLSTTMTS